MEIEIVNKIICLVAKRNSGKSVLLKYIVSQFKEEFDKLYVICPSENVNKFYSDFVPKENIFDCYSEEWVELLMQKMESKNVGKSEETAYHALLILDDCASDTKFHQSKSIKKIFTRGRHVKLSLIITCQYVYQLPPVCRSNCDYLLTSQMNAQGLKLVMSEFMSGDITKKQFVEMYNRATSNYSFLVISQNASKDNKNLNEIYGIISTPIEFVNSLKK